MVDIKALAAKAVATGKDMNVAQTGGGDYEPPAAGPTRLRFISYVEVGKQKGTFQGKPTEKDTALLTFELSGPKHKPAERDGVKYPDRISIELPVSLNEKAHFYKLFRALNHKGVAKHIAELLGDSYKGTVVHRKYKGRDGKDRIAVELFDKARGIYTIEAPRYEVVNPDEHESPGPTGEFKVLPVDPAISPLKCFLWDYADKEQWDSLFIDGQYDERKNDKGEVVAAAKSKNVLQNKIKLAVNFKGSPIYTVIASNGGSLDIPDAEDGRGSESGEEAPPVDEGGTHATSTTPTGEAATDALNAVAQPSLGM